MVVSVFNIVCYRTVKTAPPHDINNLFQPDFFNLSNLFNIASSDRF